MEIRQMRNEKTNEKKDLWDKVKILGLILGAVGTAIIAYIGADIGYKINNKLNDTSLMQGFQNVYFDDSKKTLGFTYVKLIKDGLTRYNLRVFIMWDIFKRRIASKRNLGQKFRFDPFSNSEWIDLHHNIQKMWEIDAELGDDYEDVDAEEALRYIANLSPVLFKKYSTEAELDEIFKYLNCKDPTDYKRQIHN